ncbi:hypothetical protein Dsin_004333 [Dipteronia sinensis]|uniref:NB-ARC domain-containing protein n=1 Tax=Dipteronia sinensis TaxID=43782 RepID=A0AAE0BAT9_9ROSI|nr:hypothetical protein Dsin_004333 [Dipteronia sinensis]
MLIQRRLCRKKVFVVLDDVSRDEHEQLDNLAGARDWFGPESRIVVTTRDEQVLISHKIIDEIYKVEALKGYEALELFRLKAFGQIPSASDYLQLSKHIHH